jgi:hypothetical protein
VLLKAAVIIYHDGDLITTPELPYPVIVYFLDVPEAVTSEIILHEFQKPDLLRKKSIFVLLCFTGEIEALVICYNGIILPVLVDAGELPPVDIPVNVGFAVEHERIYATDSKSAVVNPASSVVQEPAGSTVIILCP